MISTRIARASAGLLLLGGLALLFAADDILPRLIVKFPVEGAWLGQLLGAAWIAVAALDWLSQATLLGGIYGRPVVVANATLYFIAAMVLLEIVTRGDAPAVLWLLLVPAILFAIVYGWLLFRGPFARDVESQAGGQHARS